MSLGVLSARDLVVNIDGTSNQFSEKVSRFVIADVVGPDESAAQNTNVVELYHQLFKDERQVTFYNSGIGTYATPSWRSIRYLKQVLDNKIDLMIAWSALVSYV